VQWRLATFGYLFQNGANLACVNLPEGKTLESRYVISEIRFVFHGLNIIIQVDILNFPPSNDQAQGRRFVCHGLHTQLYAGIRCFRINFFILCWEPF
jgi:hypothetical protein